MSTNRVTIEQLLQTTSRTFALSIPLLPSPLDHKITLAYLVFRISDTFEDADHLDRADRRRGLYGFCELLDDMSEVAAEQWALAWNQQRVSINDHYNRLLRETPQVIAAVGELDAPSREAIVQHAKRSACGMAEFLNRADESACLSLSNLADLRRYCYFVAGIVGELITDLFILDRNDLAKASALRQFAGDFGEGLQLVNILKDASDDKKCGRVYLPEDVPVADVFELAFDDLRKAHLYVETLREMSAPPGYIAFCDAPIQLAKATLETVHKNGPGSKIPKDEMFALLQSVMERAGLAEVND